MKKLVFTSVFFLITITMMAQIPAAFNYQAVVRNSSGDIVANKAVKFRFSILQNSSTGTAVYVETQSATTNSFGLVNIKVGMGTKVSGTFNPAAWGNNDHYLKVELDPNNGTSFSTLGTEQLLAVPYAFHSQSVDEIPDNSVTSAKIADNAVTNSKIINTAVSTDKLANNAITAPKLASMGATAGQVLTYSGTAWAPQTPATGTSQWQTSGSNLYYLPGFVGIGTSTISHPLTIENANNTCYIHLKDNQGTGGMRIGAYIGEMAFINDNANKNIRFATYTGSAYKQILTLNATTQSVGINTDAPPYDLSVMGSGSPGEISIHTSVTGISATDGLRIGTSNTLNAWVWNNENGDLYFGTNNLERMRINRDGRVGIGDYTPEATLDVEGTVVIGTEGKLFSEIREITGTTAASGGIKTISYPSGYNMSNIRVLSLEINYKGNSWIGLGGNQQNTTINERIFYYLDSSNIWIYHPPVADFHNRAFRMMVMKVQ